MLAVCLYEFLANFGGQHFDSFIVSIDDFYAQIFYLVVVW